jgi:hypothetical protein
MPLRVSNFQRVFNAGVKGSVPTELCCPRRGTQKCGGPYPDRQHTISLISVGLNLDWVALAGSTGVEL